jgi:hypothetical protein
MHSGESSRHPQTFGSETQKSFSIIAYCKGNAIENQEKSHLRKSYKLLKIGRFYFNAQGPRRKVQGLKKMALKTKVLEMAQVGVWYRAG